MRGLIFVLSLLLGACATATAPINTPLTGAPSELRGRAPVGEDLIVLALSGGGARAASFHLGVLQGLRETSGRDGRPLTEHIAFITSVSGGSVLAAYYALHGEAGLDAFDAAYLARDWRVRGPASPLGLSGALRGGVNGPDQLAEWLDQNLYQGARMSDLGAGPRVVINASDIYNGAAFAFTPLFFAGVCSDLGAVRVADAVAASMAVPVAFRPVLVESHPAACNGPPAWAERVLADRGASQNVRQTARAFQNYRGESDAAQRFVHLADGGVADNLGLLSLQVLRAAEPAPSPFTAREALQARRVLFIVVNAEYLRERTYQQRGSDRIGLGEAVLAPIDVAMDVAKRASADVWRAQLPALEAAMRRLRCEAGAPDCDAVSVAMDVISFRDMTEAEYEALRATPTELSLPRATVDALIAAGRGVVARNAAVAELRGD